jgi:hypothetical protein
LTDVSGTVLDADAIIEATSPPTIVFRGQTYTGRVCSLFELLPFQEQFERLQANTKDAKLEDLFAIVRGVCDKVGIPFEVVRQMPTKALKATIAYFFAYAASGEHPKQTPRLPTPGNS